MGAMAGDDSDPANASKWTAVVKRDASADGRFVYAVRTTGVYCRPSCPARPPLRRNVSFFATSADATAAGFRACKRCQPDGASPGALTADLVQRACAIIAAAETAPLLEDLAAGLGLSPFHFHRIFKAATGITPKAYFNAERARRMRKEIDDGASITSAIYGAGYGSSSRFYETAGARLGMRPRDYRQGAAGECLRFAIGDCSLGAILVAATKRGIAAIEFGDDPAMLLAALQSRFPNANLIGADPDFDALVAAVVAHVERPVRAIDLPLDIRGTAFQEQVWQALRAIPLGDTATYAEIAAAIGSPSSTRAVANACGQNAIAVLIPCHRVVRTDGGTGGYRWGIARKTALLARERDGEPDPPAF
jgi:AraC family transcriptional regulator of adaptative response/methylated-DNA-[protein]-cysteine methyltransferase